MNRENKGIFFYDVYNGKEKLGFTRVGLHQKFSEKFPYGQAYTINNKYQEAEQASFYCYKEKETKNDLVYIFFIYYSNGNL